MKENTHGSLIHGNNNNFDYTRIDPINHIGNEGVIKVPDRLPPLGGIFLYFAPFSTANSNTFDLLIASLNSTFQKTESNHRPINIS
jgi:hypothetical protein